MATQTKPVSSKGYSTGQRLHCQICNAEIEICFPLASRQRKSLAGLGTDGGTGIAGRRAPSPKASVKAEIYFMGFISFGIGLDLKKPGQHAPGIADLQTLGCAAIEHGVPAPGGLTERHAAKITTTATQHATGTGTRM